MEIKHVHFVYFSPTGTTKKVLYKMKEHIEINSTIHDFTPFHCKYETIEFEYNDLLVVGIPVYSGRVPATFVERISFLKGKSTPVILVATYGNRDYDDALIELKTLLTQNGFVPIAAAAFVAEHNIYRAIAAGRPDEKDMEEIQAFTGRISDLLVSIDDFSDYNLHVKGNKEYRDYILMPVQPHSTKKCNRCGICAELCPSGAIPVNSPDKTDKSKCVRCMGCIRFCPKQARKLYLYQKLGAKLHLSKYTEYKSHEYFW